MDDKAFIAALRSIRTGVEDLITAVDVNAAVQETNAEQREIDLMLEFDKPDGQGLNQQQASRACKRHGYNPQQVGAWARGGWLETRDDRRYLTRKSYDWLAGAGVTAKNPPKAA